MTRLKPVIIVGGGLSGLCTAYQLHRSTIPFQLVEARDRLGGRILATDHTHVDLGPSWFWPGQRQIAQLLDELGLQNSIYPQASEGLSVMEYRDGSLQKSLGAASMAGSNRLDGGMKRLIDALAATLPADCLQTNSIVQSIERGVDGIFARIRQGGHTLDLPGSHLILALPPRIVAHAIQFEPDLQGNDGQQLNKIPTWMAGQAKFVAEYTEAFWQHQTLSGDGFSQLGPLAEIHDASPRCGNTHALFGFVGTTPDQRQGQDEALKQAALQQLTRMFGEAASQPTAVHLKDWAFDEYTATTLDREPATPRVHAHPVLNSEWDNRLIWAGTETAGLANHSNGYLEGAVESGNRAAALLKTLVS